MFRETLMRLGRSGAAKAVVTRTPLSGMARRFVPGETIDAAVEAVRAANAEGRTATVNHLGESVHDRERARRAADAYVELIDRIQREDLRSGVSLKFTQLGQEVGAGFLARNVGRVLDAADAGGTFVRFDMESSDYTRRTLDAFETLWAEGRRGIGVVLQANLRRTAGDVVRMNRLGAPVRLCKGAYAEPAGVAYQDRERVDRNFVELMRMLLSEGNHPAIATHDERMIEATVDFASREGLEPDHFEFQMLHGVRRDLQRDLLSDDWRLRVYIPFGTHWYEYLMRRLAERPANVLFLAGSVVRESPFGFLWPDGRSSRE